MKRCLLSIVLLCIPLVASAQAANDDCSAATEVGEGSHPYDLTSSTLDGPDDCDGNMLNDVWFSYTASAGGIATISTCAQTGSDTDGILIVYDGSACPAAGDPCLASSDDDCGASNFMSTVDVPVTAGSNYLVQLGGWNGSEGDGTVDIFLFNPSNDDCSAATEVGEGSHPYVLTTSTLDGPADCDDNILNDVWFSYTASGDGIVTIDTCSQTGSNTDSIIAVYDGSAGCPTSGPCLAVSDDACGDSQFMSSVDVPVTAGSNYLIQVAGWNGSEGDGTVDIYLNTGATPSNDDCSEATEVGEGSYSYDLTASTLDGPADCDGNILNDVWFSFTSSVDGIANINTCSQTGTDSDSIIVVYDGSNGCPTSGPCLASSDDACGTSQFMSTVDVPVTQGSNYLIQVAGWNGSEGDGTLDIYIPIEIVSLTLSSVPGSAVVDCEAELSEPCDSVLFTAGAGNSNQVTVNGPFVGGDIVYAALPVSSIQTMVEVCATPQSAGPPFVSTCGEIAVTGPVILEGCSTPLVGIPDAGEPIESFINISGDPSAILWDLQIDALINHPDASQLIVEISSPDGITVALHNQPARVNGGIDLTWWQNGPPNQPPYDVGGLMQPLEDLSAFTGSNPIGTWTLSVSDEETGWYGTLEEWCLRIYDTAPVPDTGQDVIMGDPTNLVMVGREGSKASFGCESVICNGGTEPLDWYANPDPRHPMMTFNMFRLDPDRLIQIGGSWTKHGWASAQADACGFGCTPHPTSTATGVGCSDTYGAAGNASQGNMGPRSDIDPWTGGFIWDGSFMQSDSGPWDQVEERLSIEDADLDPSQHPGSTWISETYVIHPGDLDHTSNFAWEPVGVSGTPGGNWSIDMSAVSQLGTVQAAWPGASIAVLQPYPAIDGRCYLAHKVTDNGDGTWHYEYSIYNLDLSGNAGSLTIPVASDVTVTNINFHAPEIHSVAYSNDAWSSVRDGEGVTWTTLDHSFGGASNPLRWGWLYNFGFDTDAAPETGTAILGVHSPSSMSFLQAQVATPPTAPPDPLFRRGLCNLDGAFDIADVIFLLSYLFSAGDAPLCADACDSNDDGGLDIGDGITMLGSLFSGDAPPAPPGPSNCGVDPTEDTLGCDEQSFGCP